MVLTGIIFLAILPVAEYLLWQGDITLNSHFNLRLITSNIVIYPCLGYYLENRMDMNKARKYISVLWLINTAAILVSCYMTYYKAAITGVCLEEYSQAFHSSFAIINVITLYTTFKCCFNKPLPSGWANLTASVGSSTFGIYLIHTTTMHFIETFNILEFMRETIHINYLVSVLIYCQIIFVTAYGITLIMKKIPGLNRII